jgi:hypothetical protein
MVSGKNQKTADILPENGNKLFHCAYMKILYLNISKTATSPREGLSGRKKDGCLRIRPENAI